MTRKPLFPNPFGSEDEPPNRGRERTSCPADRRLVKGFTRKDGRRVAPFCAKVKPERVTLSGVLKGTISESRKAVDRMVDEQGCAEVLKKLEFLARVSKDEEVRKRAREQAAALRSHPTCKIPRGGA